MTDPRPQPRRHPRTPRPAHAAWRPLAAVALAGALSAVGVSAAGATVRSADHHHHGFHHRSFLSQFSTSTEVGSTVPGNGDVNPYGIAVVTHSDGALVRGDTLISNFNDVGNTQGTGTTLVEVAPSGALTTFATLTDPVSATCPGGVGLTTALSILSNDYVVVGSLPVDTSGDIGLGCLIVVNPAGHAVAVWSGGDLNGPWDMTSAHVGHLDELFVTNVLNGTVTAAPGVATGGTVVRLDVLSRPHRTPVLLRSTVIGSGFDEQLNTAALVIGPTGVALGDGGTLYVADTLNNRIAAIPHATFRHSTFPVASGLTVFEGAPLNGPLGLMAAPNGDLVAANGADGNAVEVTPSGSVAATAQIDPLNAGGDLFGLTAAPHGNGILFVDDGNNTLQLFH